MEYINYSEQRLQQDVEERNHILTLLRQFKRDCCIRGMKVVEIGCGLGQCAALFLEDCEVLGVDGLPQIASSPHRLIQNIVVADLNHRTELHSSEFDVVLCLDVLEHLDKVHVAMGEINRILRPGGYAVINVPNHFNLKGRLRMLLSGNVDTHHFFPESPLWEYPHLRFFTHAAVLDMFRRYGFNVIRDYSAKMYDLPFLNSVRRPNSRLGSTLAELSPSLFAGGFFVVATKGKAA